MTTSNEACFVVTVMFNCVDEVYVDAFMVLWARGVETCIVEHTVSKDGLQLNLFCILPHGVAVLEAFLPLG
jgi:hypothetical protein